ncbi:MAG: GLPGLI family protein [Saprospiraceae bacterium]
MKYIYIITILLLFSFNVLDISSKSYSITYMEKEKLNLKDAENPVIPERFREDFKKMMIKESKKNTFFTLNYSNNKSLYKFDRVENLPEKSVVHYVDFYKDFTKKEIYVTGGMIGDAAIKETFSKWIYQKDTSNILGYDCQKAILIQKNNDTLTAWYASDIPIFDGPEHYAGLPGLILKYETNRKTVTATDITEITNENFKVEIPEFKNFINEKEFRNKITPK